MGAEMYEGMSNLQPPSPAIERGIALHKMIRAVSLMLLPLASRMPEVPARDLQLRCTIWDVLCHAILMTPTLGRLQYKTTAHFLHVHVRNVRAGDNGNRRRRVAGLHGQRVRAPRVD
jgi:hypothetical protein